MSTVNFTEKDYLGTKKDEDYTKQALLYVKKLLIPLSKYVKSSDVILYGSSRIRLQPYYSDIDTINLVDFYKDVPTEDIGEIMRKKILKNIKKLPKTAFVTDIKAGAYPDGNHIHWTVKEVEEGKRNGEMPDFNGHKGDKI